MLSLTGKEREALLLLFKGLSAHYNANSMGKVLGMSHVGAQKMLKRMVKENLLTSQRIGKAIVYRLNLQEEYARILISFLLADEANAAFKRWKEEFRGIFKEGRIILLYGSTLRDYASARDIDLMVVVDAKERKAVRKAIEEKQSILPKKLHAIELTEEELIQNIKNGQEAAMDIVKNAVVLYGQDKYVEVIRNVSGA
jgi:predicted nucleotidyltransferase